MLASDALYVSQCCLLKLRHCWQEYKGNGKYYEKYEPNNNINILDFAEQREKIDAEAYASLYVEKHLRVSDGTALMFDPQEDIIGWDDYIAKVKARMKEICACNLDE